VEDFDLHKELYRGKTSLVYMATDKQSGVQVALKLYRKRKLSTMNRWGTVSSLQACKHLHQLSCISSAVQLWTSLMLHCFCAALNHVQLFPRE